MSQSVPMLNPQKGRTGLTRLRHAAGYSMEGLACAFRNESAFRDETLIAMVMLPASFWLGQTWLEVGLLAGSVLLVMLVELLNSAIEATVDRISLERHELAKRAKDYGSAAVLLATLWCGGLWLAALWHRFGT